MHRSTVSNSDAPNNAYVSTPEPADFQRQCAAEADLELAHLLARAAVILRERAEHELWGHVA